MLATIACGNCVPQARHQRRGARPPRLCRPQAASIVKEAAHVHRVLPRVRYVRETPLSSEQDGMIYGSDLPWCATNILRIFFQEGLDKSNSISVFPKGDLPVGPYQSVGWAEARLRRAHHDVRVRQDGGHGAKSAPLSTLALTLSLRTIAGRMAHSGFSGKSAGIL